MDITTLINTDKEWLVGEIKRLAGSEKKRVRSIHVLAMSTTLHTIQHGDHTLCSRLVEAISGKDAKSVVTWLCAFAPLSVGDITVKNEKGELVEKKGFVYDKERRDALKARIARPDGRKAFIAEMNEKTYEALSPDKPFEGLEFKALLAGIIKRTETQAKKYPDKVDTVGLAQAKLLFQSLRDADDGDNGDDGDAPQSAPAAATDDAAASASVH